MRIETKPFGKRVYTPPDSEKIKVMGWAGSKMEHEPLPVLAPRAGLFKCPKCGGAVKEEVDDFQLVLGCINCGWDRCSLEPDHKVEQQREAAFIRWGKL
jgi:hypothetical protein